jgi:hypothetical protein
MKASKNAILTNQVHWNPPMNFLKDNLVDFYLVILNKVNSDENNILFLLIALFKAHIKNLRN